MVRPLLLPLLRTHFNRVRPVRIAGRIQGLPARLQWELTWNNSLVSNQANQRSILLPQSNSYEIERYALLAALEGIGLSHARNLRAIGQSLELTRVEAFKVENHGASYLVRSQAITRTCYWMVNNNLVENAEDQTPGAKPSSLKGGDGWLQYEPPIIARLDAQARKKRRGYIASQSPSVSKSSQRLRTLGAHLDRVEATAFTISWDPHSVTVNYQSSDGQEEQRTFSFEKLDQLGFHMRIRRSSRSL